MKGSPEFPSEEKHPLNFVFLPRRGCALDTVSAALHSSRGRRRKFSMKKETVQNLAPQHSTV